MYRSKLNSLFQTAVKTTRTQIIRSSSYHVSRKIILRDNLVKYRCYSSSSDKSDDQSESADKSVTKPAVKAGVGKYKVFADYDSPVILDVDEERLLRLEKPELFEIEEEKEDEFAGISLERGVDGVFDVEELVAILRKEDAKKLVVLEIPPHYQYVDHMIIVSGRSLKHLIAMAEFIKKLYKRKKSEEDYFPIIEGKKSTDWMALDLGNIALHFQTDACRSKFDIEKLWAVGPEFDDQSNEKEDQYITLLNQHTAIADLEPLEPLEIRQSSKNDINNSLA